MGIMKHSLFKMFFNVQLFQVNMLLVYASVRVLFLDNGLFIDERSGTYKLRLMRVYRYIK